MFLLLTRYHYWLGNITVFLFASWSIDSRGLTHTHTNIANSGNVANIAIIANIANIANIVYYTI